MKNLTSKLVQLLLTFILLISFLACNQEDSLLLSDSNTLSDKEALEKIVDEDESIQSFDVNYDEEEAMDFILGKTAEEIYPVRVGQKMRLVERNLVIRFEGDEAFGTLTKTFEGILFIVASNEPIDVPIDEIDLDVYEKPFSTSITRNLKFVKIDNTENPLDNWILTAVSLPVGGTPDEKSKFTELQKGIRAFGTGFLMVGNFRIDDAVPAAARIAYLATKILYKELSPLEFYKGQDIKELSIENQDWNFLNRLKKQSDKSSFYYWYKTLEIMNLIKQVNRSLFLVMKKV